MQIEKNTSKLRKHHQIDNTCAENTHNANKYRNALQIAKTTTEMFEKTSTSDEPGSNTGLLHYMAKSKCPLEINSLERGTVI